MTHTRSIPWAALLCMSALAACAADDDGGVAGNTELNVIVPNNESSPGVPAPIDIQTVEYTINCDGNDDTFLDNDDSFADEVRLEGNLEVVDGRTDPQGAIPPEFGTPRPGDGAEVWQGFMDLPPGPCTIQLRARDNDGEVICTATEPFVITADTTAKVNLVLICDVSYQAPVGMLDVDATFSFVVGNFCPDLFVLNCLDSNPAEQQILPPPFPPIASTTCEVRFRDGDSTCGQGCDPQTCVVTTEGIDCTPGPDPGVSTTVTCADAQIDCDFNPLTTETECTFTGDTLGVTPIGGPIVPNAPGAGAFAVACIPPSLGGFPGVTAVCTAVTTDGDEDCNKTKVVAVNCVGEPPCFFYAADGYVCNDGNDCTNDFCDDTGLLDCGVGDNGPCCMATDLPAGNVCTSALPPAFCDGAGSCVSICCNAQPDPDASCDDGNPCTANSCLASCLCTTDPVAGGTACDAGAGPTSGVCDGVGTCEDVCSVNPPCPEDSNQCTAASCDPADGSCGQAPANDGGSCDFIGPGLGGGLCYGGVCTLALGASCNFDMMGTDNVPQISIVSVGCSSLTAAQSPFPFTLIVDVPGPVANGFPFDATFDGVGVLPEFFLDAAQGVVPGGVQVAELVDIVATVQIRSGATGPDVPLLADVGSLTPGAVRFCDFPTTTVCTCPPGTLPGDTCANGACLGGFCQPEQVLAALPTSTDCAVGGACDVLGKTGAGSQCALNGYCITGDLIIQFEASATTTYTVTGPSGSSVLFGWADGVGAGTTPVPGLTLCPAAAPDCTEAFMPDGCYDLPAAVFSDPPAPIGIRVNASGLFVPIQCAQAEPGGICASGEGCLVDGDCATAPCTITTDVVCPTPDASLISCPIN